MAGMSDVVILMHVRFTDKDKTYILLSCGSNAMPAVDPRYLKLFLMSISTCDERFTLLSTTSGPFRLKSKRVPWIWGTALPKYKKSPLNMNNLDNG